MPTFPEPVVLPEPINFPTFEVIYNGFVIGVMMLYMILTVWFYIPIACVIYRKFNAKRKYKKSTDKRLPHARTCVNGIEIGTVSEHVQIPQIDVSVEKYNRCKTNFNMMFFTIISVYLLSYVPMCVMLGYTKIEHQLWTDISLSEFNVYIGLIRSYIINHTANPFIYVYFDTSLRQKVAALFCKTY